MQMSLSMHSNFKERRNSTNGDRKMSQNHMFQKKAVLNVRAVLTAMAVATGNLIRNWISNNKIIKVKALTWVIEFRV